MPRTPDPLNRFILHPLQALAAVALYGIFRLLPLDAASGFGGWIGRTVGPRIGISNRARRNLARAFPEKSSPEIETIVRGMWDNLGRMVAEYPHLGEIDVYDPNGPVEVIGIEHVEALRDDGRPGLFYSAHMANWELLSLGATQRGLPLDRVYREANNRLVEWLYRRGRAAVEGALIPKGPHGVKQLLASLKGGNHLAMLVDQKMNDGIAVPYFGIDVMTAPALADLAIRFDCPVVAARVERLGGARFRFIAEAPITFADTGDRKADVLAAMTQVNARIEEWVRATPEQWLWLHNRFPD